MRKKIKKMKKQTTHWNKIFTKDTPDKVVLFKLYKELLKLNSKKTKQITWLKSKPKTLTDTSLKKIYRWQMCHIICHQANANLTRRYHCRAIKMAKIWNTDLTKCWWEFGVIEPLIRCWECRVILTLEDRLAVSYKTKLTTCSSNHTPWHLLKRVENLCAQKNLHRCFSTFIGND